MSSINASVRSQTTASAIAIALAAAASPGHLILVRRHSGQPELPENCHWLEFAEAGIALRMVYHSAGTRVSRSAIGQKTAIPEALTAIDSPRSPRS